MLNAKIQLDERASDQLIAALQELPLEYRQKFLLKAQKSALAPVQRAARTIAKAKTGSGPLAQSINTVKGRYIKATGGAYSVIENRDKRVNRTRKLGKYIIPHVSNYANIERFILNGTQSNLRTAGKRTRKDSAGQMNVVTGNKNASGFVVQGSGGQWMKIKKIRYKGNNGHPYYDMAFTEQMATAESKFAAEVFDKLAEFKRKNGFG